MENMEEKNKNYKFYVSVNFKGHGLRNYEFNTNEDMGNDLVDLIQSFYGEDFVVDYEYYEIK